jgi:hypothetical protein
MPGCAQGVPARVEEELGLSAERDLVHPSSLDRGEQGGNAR